MQTAPAVSEYRSFIGPDVSWREILANRALPSVAKSNFWWAVRNKVLKELKYTIRSLKQTTLMQDDIVQDKNNFGLSFEQMVVFNKEPNENNT